MNEPTEEKPKRSATVAWVVVGSVMIYLLAVGPLFKFGLSHPEFLPPLQRIYAPLGYLENNLPWLSYPIGAYLKLWGVN